MTQPPDLLVGPDHPVTLNALEALAMRRGARLELDPKAQRRVARSHELLCDLVARGARVYGVTTGYGPLATWHVSQDQGAALQRNLVYHLASGVGPMFGTKEARAIFAARIICLAQGASGVSPATLERLMRMFSRGIVPAIPALGSVGASGDLTPLAHMALCLMGEGGALEQGQVIPSLTALQHVGLEPLELQDREGLALVNGTSAMTALAACSGAEFERALELAVRLAVGSMEVLGGKLEGWHSGLGQIRPHPGQQWAHQQLNRLVAGSERVHHSQGVVGHQAAWGELADTDELPQDAYTLRCAPQILGALWDQARWHQDVVERELNAVTDNPVFLPGLAHAIHGGNFYGQHVAMASDALKNAMISLMVWSERVIARLVDPALHRRPDLPAFMQSDGLGLRSGFMGAQVTATALVAWARGQAYPASTSSIPTNANNQDVVSMGTLAAYQGRQVIGHMWEVLAIHALIVAQGVEHMNKDGVGPAFSSSTLELIRWIRTHVPSLVGDRPLGGDIERLAKKMCDQS